MARSGQALDRGDHVGRVQLVKDDKHPGLRPSQAPVPRRKPIANAKCGRSRGGQERPELDNRCAAAHAVGAALRRSDSALYMS
jgi:hypothetical protein